MSEVGSMSADMKELGTLIVVVGKARNLPNKSRFGKQDPFCTVAVGEHKQKTKAIKRGGQTPEWDEELRFTIVENVDDLLVRSESQPGDSLSSLARDPTLPPKDAPGVVTPAALANRSRKGPIGKKGGKSLRIACFADDAKEPELIGECVVDIEHVLKQGEEDEWYELTYKEKYSGEIYMELTFYSNNAPPVKRNVPRPSVHGYPSSSTAGSISSRSSLSAATSTSTLAAPHSRLSTSGSVSGMSLYIPPYVQQPARAPSPSPSGTVSASPSFQDLGLPPGHTRTPSMQSIAPGQPAYPPSAHQSVLHSAFEALTTPMASLSIDPAAGPSYPDRSSTPVPQNQHAYRHSVGGASDAPWADQLPQARMRIAPTPLPRPMSTNDAIPWQQLQQADVERRTSGASGIVRPVSGQGQGQGYARPSSAAPGAVAIPMGSEYPPSLQPGQAPHHRHTSSFSHLAAALQAQSPLPPPPLAHAQTAPPTTSSTSHYQIPASSFPTQSVSHQGAYQPYSARPAESYPPTPPGPGPASAPPDAPNNAGYVPWYQQTQPAAPPPDPRRASTPTGHYQPPYQPQSTPLGQYTSAPPPPIPAHRPGPSPAPPPRPTSVGYYPSDELYAVQERERLSQSQGYRAPSPAPPAMPPMPMSSSSSVVPWEMRSHQHQHAAPSYQATSTYTHEPTPPPSLYSSQSQPYVYDAPGHSHPAAPEHHRAHSSISSLPPHEAQGAPVGWHPTVPYAPPRSPSPLPPSQSQPNGSYYTPTPPSRSYPYHSQPPPQPSHAYPHASRSPSPLPPAQSAPSSWQTNGDHSPMPPAPAPPPRSPSPLPPSQTFHSYSQSTQPYQPNPSHSFSGSPSLADTPPHLHMHQQQQQQQQPRQDWRSYLQSLNNGSPNSAPRAPSPQPPSLQQKIHSPPPPLPDSIRPPDGWRSTVPPSNDGQQWRGY